MNSLNILSSHITPSSSPTASRSNSIPAISLTVTSEADSPGDIGDSAAASPSEVESLLYPGRPSTSDPTDSDAGSSIVTSELYSYDDPATPLSVDGAMDETTPILAQKDMHGGVSSSTNVRLCKWRSLPKQIALTVWHSIRWVLQTLAAPGAYLLAFLCDDQGTFSPLGVAKLLFQRPRPPLNGGGIPGKPSPYLAEDDNFLQKSEKSRRLSTDSDGSFSTWTSSGRFLKASSSSTYAVSSESESELDRRGGDLARGGQGLRRKGTSGSGSGSVSRRGTAGRSSGGEDNSMTGAGGSGSSGSSGNRRSVRIKLNDDTQKQRKHRRGQTSMRSGSTSGSSFSGSGAAGDDATKDISAQLKSPTSPAGALTRYPRTPAPPRPLIPRRQPSYLNLEPADRAHQKTLILDLDETLIHSMSKGGRMSTGHMVEVRLNTMFVGMGGQPSAGPQHPILYYVHKRPYCDEFLRRVCKWFNLVVFTASVQEYADPVIDWLESERKFFSARYYRQHCTFRHGAFIKDLSAVEPDLSKVMILDNSPLSYMFHQDNAIPIQGWISDHTDNDLLYLVPLLEALQYVSDVRALLALRGGEDGRHMA